MVDSLMVIEPDAAPHRATRSTPQERLEQFRQANASLSLEGLIVDPDDLEIQGRVARGELTADEAVAAYLRLAGKAPT